ncbi:LysR family transcriptional regulator [Rhizobium binxianense]
MTINLRQLRYFAEVIKAGNISHAALRLELAQTAISIQIRELEQEIGVRLFDRHSRGVVPTDAGALLFERYNELEQHLERTVRDVRSAGNMANQPFVIGLTPSRMRLVGANILIAASERRLARPVHLVEELSFSLIEALERKELNLALAYDVESRPSLVREAIIQDELVLVTSAMNAKGEGPITFAEALAEELCFAGERGIASLVRRTAQHLSLPCRIATDIQSVSAIRSRVAEGGASFLPYGSVVDGVNRGIFSVRRIVRPTLYRTLYMVRRSEERSPLDDDNLGPFIKDFVRRIHFASQPYSTIVDSRFEDA